MIKLAIIILLLFSSVASASNYALDIININKAGLSSRIHYAYTGIPYSIGVGARGGVYPYIYALTSAPTGMAINTSTGRISWSSPTEAGSPHTVTVSVTDMENKTVSETWSIAVSTDTDKFHFIDSTNGKTVANGGTGTLANPWKEMADFYLSESDSTYANDFIYFRSGTYTLYHVPGSTSNERGAGADRIIFNPSHPSVYLAYPGETVTINQEADGSTGKNIFLNSKGDAWFQGITFNNAWQYSFEITNSANLTILDCNFTHGQTNGISGSNQSYLAGVDTASHTNYSYIADNVFNNDSSATYLAGIKTYGTYLSVFERNSLAGMSEGISIKSYSDSNTIRKNTILGGNIGLVIEGYGHTNDNEVCFNYVHNASLPISLTSAEHIGTTYIYRNTFDNVAPQFKLFKITDGMIYSNNNVIINPSTDSSFSQNFIKSKHQFQYFTAGSEQTIYENNFVVNNNLTGILTDNIIDTNGSLTTEYLSNVSIYGWEISSLLAEDVYPPTTSHNGQSNSATAQTITLTPNETATTQYCTGTAACTPSLAYSAPLSVKPGKFLCFKSTDSAANVEATKCQYYGFPVRCQ